MGLEYTSKKEGNGIRMNCTKCPFADPYIKVHGEDWGFIFHCGNDEPLTRGFNEKIGFERTKTIMEGDEVCDHYYFYKE